MVTMIGIICIILIIGIPIYRAIFDAELQKIRSYAISQGKKPEEVKAIADQEVFLVPESARKYSCWILAVCILFNMFSFMFFYAEPTYIYHIRTIFNQERKVDGVGWSYYGGGEVTEWKKAVTVQAANNTGAKQTDQISGGGNAVSANLLPQNVIFLDNVDADASGSVRFRIPTDTDTFLNMVHEYRTPENLLLTSLIPAFKETLQATASLMSAEEYFAGSRTSFGAEFENQLRDGIYIVKREQRRVLDTSQTTKRSANASKSTQDTNDDHYKVVFTVVKLEDENGELVRKKQAFSNYGISIIEARIPGMEPNSGFSIRMTKKQKASADLAIARENRIKEDEQRLFVIAKGQREAAERAATWMADQVEHTTKAETDKQLALTSASKLKEAAEIDKQTADILLAKATIDAKAIVITAEAEAKERRLKIQSDNGLRMKIDALVQMNKDNALAFSKRAVPSTVVYSGGTKHGQLGSSTDMDTVVTSQMLKNLRALDIDIGVTQ